ncbi:hypothetical protein ACFYW6_23995 [Streptomyces sp. NPDC002659]|uniref:hypothetical protein n=1 Tax=Streptomyces sp. NPDC002659 TaxID=3364656 RepID=UPI0036BDE7D4
MVTTQACTDEGSADPKPNVTVRIGDTEIRTGPDGTSRGTIESEPHEVTGTPPHVLSVNVTTTGEEGPGVRGPNGTQVTFEPVTDAPPSGSESDCQVALRFEKTDEACGSPGAVGLPSANQARTRHE